MLKWELKILVRKIFILENLFLNYISKNTDLSDKQYELIESILKENPKILSSPDLLKINRCVSYMTFILKEICDYICARLPNETPLFGIRKLNRLKLFVTDRIKYYEGYLK